MERHDGDKMGSWVRPTVWAGTAAAIYLPLLALKLFDPQTWQMEDLPFTLVFLVSIGLIFELSVRTPSTRAYGTGATLALATAFLLTWSNLAVGLTGSEDNPINLIYFSVVAVAAVGAMLARLKPRGMAVAMAATAGGQIAAAIVAQTNGFFTGPLTLFFCALWLASGWLFRKAERHHHPTARR